MSSRYALVGQPVAHSRSPQIHRQFAAQLGHDMSYELLECGADQLASTVEAFFAAGGKGMNVTLPYKNAVMETCAQVSADAQLAKAVNTLVPHANGLQGENTDGAGLIRDLQRLGVTLQGKRIAVIGAGGAARGIIKPLLDSKPAELVWSHRNPLKLEGLDSEFAAYGTVVCRANLALKGDRYDLLIHATSAGHQCLAPFLPDALVADGGVAYDLSYGKAALPFLAWAQAQGVQTRHDGLGMLVEQAALAYQHWTGQMPDTAAVHQSLRASIAA